MLIWIAIICQTTVSAQGFVDYSWVDARMRSISPAATYSTSQIAAYIQQNFTSNRDKIRAAYSWVTSNIRYNRDSMFYRYWGDDPERKLSSVLKTRKGVCEDYANLFTSITNRCGIPGYVVTGYTKITGRLNTTGHSWCAIKADDEWLLCDPTWDEGSNSQSNYYLLAPDQFIATHFPFDPLWQLVGHPISAMDFKTGRSASTAVDRQLHFTDSADQYLLLDSLQQKEATARRLLQTGLKDENLRTWYSYNNMKIRIVREESDMESFNAAVSACNESKALYNDLVSYRNNQFSPQRTETSIHASFAAIDALLHSAYQKMNSVGSKTENYQYDTEGLKITLDVLSSKVTNQKLYFSTQLAGEIHSGLPQQR